MNRRELLDFNEAVQHPGKKLSFDVSTELESEADLDLMEPIRGRIEGVSSGNVLFVSGKFVAVTTLECARCTHPLQQSVEFTMEDEFDVEGVPSSFARDGYAEVVEEEDVKVFEKNAMIYVRWLRQGLLLNLPAQPLCEHGWDEPCPHAEALGWKPPEPEGRPEFQKLFELKLSDQEQE